MQGGTMNLRDFIRDIPDFPQKGIVFRDLTPLMGDADAFAFAVDELAKQFRTDRINKIVGVEARGFIIGAALAYALHVGFVPARKPGKLPYLSLIHISEPTRLGMISYAVFCLKKKKKKQKTQK